MERRRCPVGNSAPAHTRVGNQTVRFSGSDMRFFFDATRNTDRFEDKAVPQGKTKLNCSRAIGVAAHLTMLNAIIGGGRSCDFFLFFFFFQSV